MSCVTDAKHPHFKLDFKRQLIFIPIIFPGLGFLPYIYSAIFFMPEYSLEVINLFQSRDKIYFFIDLAKITLQQDVTE